MAHGSVVAVVVGISAGGLDRQARCEQARLRLRIRVVWSEIQAAVRYSLISPAQVLCRSMVWPGSIGTTTPSSSGECWSVLQVLMIGFPLLPLGLSGGALLMGLGRLRSLVAIYAVGAVINVGLDIALIAEHAAIGAAWANTAAQAVISIALAIAVHRVVGGLDIVPAHLLRGAAVNGAAMVLGLLVAEQAGSPSSALILSGTVVVLVSWLGGGLARVFPAADVDWLAEAIGARLGPRAAKIVHAGLAPFG